MSKPVFVYVIYIASTPEKVFKALTDTEATAKFWFGNAATSNWKVGSPIEFHRESKLILQGKILENDPPRRLSYTFHSMHEPFYGAEQLSLRDRKAEGSGQAYRHPRRVRGRQQGVREHQPGLAARSEMVLASAINSLNFLVELYAYYRGASASPALVPPFVLILLAGIGLLVVWRLRSPAMLEAAMIATAVISTVTRLGALHPALTYMWPTMMVGLMFVIYLYLPVRFVTSVALALVFSLVTPAWWAWSLGTALPADQLYRGIVWLLFANALGFITANSLQRGQRTQFAQSLVLRQLLSTDASTGIPNRCRFDAALAREWRRCARACAALAADDRYRSLQGL